MRNGFLKTTVISFWVGAMALSAAACGGGPILSLKLCGRIFNEAGQPLRSGTATFHVVWIADGVQYDSDEFGSPTAEIGAAGKACFHGGVGFTATTYNTRLVSLTVRVHDEGTGTELSGGANRLRESYNSRLEELYMSADFALQPGAETLAPPPTPVTG